MVFLHPVFTILILTLIFYSFVEVNRGVESKTSKYVFWAIASYMIIIVGYRNYVGADYPVYQGIYNKYFPTVDFVILFD